MKYLKVIEHGRKFRGYLGFFDSSNFGMTPLVVDNAVVPHVELFASKAAAKNGGYDLVRRVTITLDDE